MIGWLIVGAVILAAFVGAALYGRFGGPRDEYEPPTKAPEETAPVASVFDTEGGKAFVDNLRRITPEADRMIAEARRQEHR